MPYVDTHAHLDAPAFEPDLDAVLQRAREAGVSRLIAIGSESATWERTLDLARSQPGVWATAGCHPHDAQAFDESTRTRLAQICQDPRVVAVGEIGLDYYRMNSPLEAQREAFAWQLELARRLGKPVVVHARQADADILAMLQEHRGVRGVLHSFAGDETMARACLELGWYLACNGILTFPSAGQTRAVLAAVPLDRIVLETDCPYLSPVPRRGRRNEPAHLPFVAAVAAEVLELPVERVAAETTRNALALFGLS